MAKKGRPTVFTPEVIGRIEEAAALDASVEEMAFYAGINRDTLYSKLQDDKDFSDRVEALRSRPIMKARKTIVDSLEDVDGAQWYLERKRKREFSTRVEHADEVDVKVTFDPSFTENAPTPETETDSEQSC